MCIKLVAETGKKYNLEHALRQNTNGKLGIQSSVELLHSDPPSVNSNAKKKDNIIKRFSAALSMRGASAAAAGAGSAAATA